MAFHALACSGRAIETTSPASGEASTEAQPTSTPSPGGDLGSGPGGCFTREELAARQARAAADREAAFDGALRAAKLARVALPAHTLVRGHGPLSGPIPEPRVEDRTIEGGQTARVIVTPPTGGCGDLSKAFDFARAGDSVYLIERRVERFNKIDVTLCPCASCACATPSAPPCGGMAVALDTILGFELPPGATFAGTHEITYVEDAVSVGAALPPQPICAAPAQRP
ncbi:MAG: hypothetical protein U0414_40060 [Polyangiaceae bacterium]